MPSEASIEKGFEPGAATAEGIRVDALAAGYIDSHSRFTTAESILGDLAERINRGEITDIDAANVATALGLSSSH